MRLASVLPNWSLRALSRRLRPLPDLDPDEAGPTPQAVSAAERAELAAARDFSALPGPAAWPVIGSAGAFVGADPSRLDQLFGRLRARYGDLYRLAHPLRGTETVVTFRSQDAEKVFRNEGSWPIRPGFYPVRVYNSINGLKHGLLPSNGSEWSELRAVVQQQFLRANALRPFIPHIESSAADLVEALAADRDPQGRLERDFLLHGYRATFDVIQKVSLGTTACRDPQERSLLLRNIRNFFNLTAELEMHVNTWRYFATSKWKRFTRVLDAFNEIADKWTSTALSQPRSEEPGMIAMLHQKGLTRDQINALVVDFFIGAVDTTGLSLTCLMYHLATNPDCQERAYREVCENVPPPGQVMTQDHTNSLTYIRACVKENFRINAPLLGNGRKLGKDIVLGGSRIPKGKVVFMVNHMVARRSSEFPDPDRFVPERWLRDRSEEGAPAAPAPAPAAAACPFASLPFGHGRRMCIGRRLAEQELMIFTTRILQTFRVEYTGPPLQLQTRLACTPDAPLQFTLVEREDTAADRRSAAQVTA